MLENTIPQLDQLIEQMIENNNQYKNQINELKEQNAKLQEDNETLQLEVLESDEKHSQVKDNLEQLLGKLQNVQKDN